MPARSGCYLSFVTSVASAFGTADGSQIPGVDASSSLIAAANHHLPVIPQLTGFFNPRPGARYHVSLLAVEDDVHVPAAFTAAKRLRFETYNSYGWFDESAMDPEGGESDEFDERAAHFGVLKNTDSGVQLIATSRLILKRHAESRLPVENHYPEAFPEGIAPTPSTESSRLISRSWWKRERNLASLACQRAMIGWGITHGFDRSFAIVEEYLLRRLDESHLPYKRLTALKPLAQYGNSKTLAVSINPHEALGEFSHPNVFRVPVATRLFYRGLRQTQGLGFYSKSFLRHMGAAAPDQREHVHAPT